MGSRIFYTIKTQFDFVDKVLLYDSLHDNMYRVVSFFWSCLCSYTCYIFGSFSRHFFRFQKSKSLEKYESNSNKTASSFSMDSEIDQTNGENSVAMGTALSASTNRYEFLSGKGISGFLEQPRTVSFIVHELFLDSKNDAIISKPIFDNGESTEEDFYDVGLATEKSEQAEKTEFSVESFMIDDEVIKKQGREKFIEEIISEDEDLVSDDEGIGNQELDAEETENSVENLDNGFEVEQNSSGEVQLLSQCQSLSSDAEEKSVSSDDELSKRKDEIDSTSNELSAIQTPIEASEPEMEEHIRETEPILNGVELESCEFVDEEMTEDTREPEAVFMRDQFTDSDDEYIELKPEQKYSTEDLSNVVDRQEQEEAVQEKAEPKPDDGFEISEDKKSSNDIDYMYEHEDIIEQLKLELKLARTGGLPTILEESESEELETPKTVQELKPMKIDEKKYEHKDVLNGIQKVYKSYLDKMRKLDILNFQTMHALGLLQRKETVDQFETARKSSVLAITSLLSQNSWLCKGSAVVDPLKKVIADMDRVFETIYVGQLCLSWEILHWQYWKVQELQNYDDSPGYHQYNQVASEFQLFQVLIQRFVENEQFQGPRVQNYVENRCVLRSLLQVPAVKDDCIKDKGNRGDEVEEYAITSEMLRGMVELSMRVFWEFLRADKDESNVIFQGNLQTHPNLQDHVDLELLIDVRTDFQKKDKKLKDILRSGNCIVKRFKKQQEDGVHQTLFILITQVELKLISRVLNMSKLTTDQLIWCHEKLDKINICNRKVFVESSFLLFPC